VHTEWVVDFFFTKSFSKCVCLICRSTIAVPKKGNVERHFWTVHKSYDTDFPPKSELRNRKVNELKSQSTRQQSFFTQHTSKAKAATEASFRVCHAIVKNKNSLQDGEMVKEAFVEAADSLNCEFFSLQLGESTDVSDTAKMCVFICMVFSDITAKEELLTVLFMKEQTRGEDIFQTFKNFIEKTELPMYKLVSITTDGAPAMVGRDDAFPDFLNYHCIIHQQALCAKMLNMKEIMDVATKIACSIRARSLQRRLFRAHL
uniref:SPIN-DOC-like zinc-finger domain-containing protein n=1 Tax=Ciona savignyi TaxID=51511 RepID=H2Z396_CIOSA